MSTIRRIVLGWCGLVGVSAAQAGELDVTWVTLPAGSRGGITMLDVQAGTIPPVELRGPSGSRYRLAIEIKPEANDVVTLEGQIDRVRLRRNGSMKLKEISRWAVSTTDGDSASLTFAPKSDLTFEIEFAPRLEKSLNRPPILERAKADPSTREDADEEKSESPPAAEEAPSDAPSDAPAAGDAAPEESGEATPEEGEAGGAEESSESSPE